jgi:hypothetical protein
MGMTPDTLTLAALREMVDRVGPPPLFPRMRHAICPPRDEIRVHALGMPWSVHVESYCPPDRIFVLDEAYRLVCVIHLPLTQPTRSTMSTRSTGITANAWHATDRVIYPGESHRLDDLILAGIIAGKILRQAGSTDKEEPTVRYPRWEAWAFRWKNDGSDAALAASEAFAAFDPDGRVDIVTHLNGLTYCVTETYLFPSPTGVEHPVDVADLADGWYLYVAPEEPETTPDVDSTSTVDPSLGTIAELKDTIISLEYELSAVRDTLEYELSEVRDTLRASESEVEHLTAQLTALALTIETSDGARTVNRSKKSKGGT